MDSPLTIWYCDVCGAKINSIEEGYVIWRSNNSKRLDFKIIHQNKCDSGEYPSSMPLDTFVGEEGLAYLLSMLSAGTIGKNLGKEDYCSIKDFGEYVDFVRRVQTPYYEEARRYFGSQQALDRHHDSNEVSPYNPDSLKELVAVFNP